jgi:DNA sulfur modification protein DndD
MKLISLKIQNFRSFNGETDLEFSTDPSKPITIFIGENSGGKSSLMNALVWCMFNEMLPGTDDLHDIRNDDSDPYDDVLVRIVFEHTNKKFEVIRGISSINGPYFKYHSIDENGISKIISSGEKEINKIIPKNLRSWFFYAGESALDKVNLSGSKDFKESLNQIQGFTLVKQLLDDLDDVEKSKKRDLQRFGVTNSNSLRSLIDQKEKILLPLIKSQEKIDVEIRQKCQEKAAINEELKGLPKSKDLSISKEKLKSEISKKNAQIKFKRAQQVLLEGNSLPSLLLYSSVNQYKAEIYQDTKDSLIIEEPYGKKLFDKIMKDHLCICGRSVDEGSAEESFLNALKAEAKPDSFNSRVAIIESLLSEIENFSESFKIKYSVISNEIESFEQEIEEKEEELKSIETELRKIDEEAYQKLLQKDLSLDAEIAQLRISWGRDDQRKIELERDIHTMEAEIERNANKENLYSGIKKFLKNIGIVKNYVSEKLAKDELRSLQIINVELNLLIEKYYYENFKATIDPETYAVSLVNSSPASEEDQDEFESDPYLEPDLYMDTKIKGRKKKKSDGQSELLKYFFITTVLGLAGRRTTEKIEYLSEPTIAPLVIDAPFTKLSTAFTSRAVEAFVDKIEQMIFLSLPDKFQNYENIIDGKIGKTYLLVKGVEGEQGNKEPPMKYKVCGSEHEFVKYGCKISSTLVERI